MKRLTLLSCIILSLLALTLASYANETKIREAPFFSEIDDFPLMYGLKEVLGASLIFDSLGGRIIEAYAQGHVSIDQVSNFYKKSLPQFGWQSIGKNKYLREKEVLEISIVPSEIASVTNIFKFSISPKNVGETP